MAEVEEAGRGQAVPTRRTTRSLVALASAVAACILGLSYLGIALTQVDDETSESVATDLGDSSLAPAIENAVEESSRTVGVIGVLTCLVALALSLAVLRSERLRGERVRGGGRVIATIAAIVPASLAIFVVVIVATEIWLNATS